MGLMSLKNGIAYYFMDSAAMTTRANPQSQLSPRVPLYTRVFITFVSVGNYFFIEVGGSAN